MFIKTVRQIKETIRDGMHVYITPSSLRVIDAKTMKGIMLVKVMHYSGKTQWIETNPNDIYAQW